MLRLRRAEADGEANPSMSPARFDRPGSSYFPDSLPAILGRTRRFSWRNGGAVLANHERCQGRGRTAGSRRLCDAEERRFHGRARSAPPLRLRRDCLNVARDQREVSWRRGREAEHRRAPARRAGRRIRSPAGGPPVAPRPTARTPQTTTSLTLSADRTHSAAPPRRSENRLSPSTPPTPRPASSSHRRRACGCCPCRRAGCPRRHSRWPCCAS